MQLFGLGLSKILVLWKLVQATPWIWKLITNQAVIREILKDLWIIFESSKKNRGIPSCEDSKKLITCVAKIFEHDLIDLPELDEMEFARMLREMEHQVVCSIKMNGGK